MKTNRESAEKRLLGAIGKGLRAAPINDEEWNFALCPQLEQEGCYVYEYSLECKDVKAEVQSVREKEILCGANKGRFEDWVRSNPMPSNQAERQEWSKRALKANPHVIVCSKLRYVSFLSSCSHFPKKHWLEIPAEERKQIAPQPDRLQWGFGPVFEEKSRMFIQSLEDFLIVKLRWFGYAFSKKLPQGSGDHVFSLYWARSDKKLLEDFKQWLEENRPAAQPPFHKTRESTSRKTSYKDLLKVLGALRLLRAFKSDWDAAASHTVKICGRSLYAEQKGWLDAEVKAHKEIRDFQTRMFRI